MPRISYVQLIDISPEKFLEACDPAELHETLLLLNTPRFSNKMKEGVQDPEEDILEAQKDDPRQIKVPWWDDVKLLK